MCMLSSDRNSGRRPSSQKDCQRVAILCDDRVGYFSIFGKCYIRTSDLIFGQRLDLDEARLFFSLQNFEICLRKKGGLHLEATPFS